jgi:hypothetical protein
MEVRMSDINNGGVTAAVSYGVHMNITVLPDEETRVLDYLRGLKPFDDILDHWFYGPENSKLRHRFAKLTSIEDIKQAFLDVLHCDDEIATDLSTELLDLVYEKLLHKEAETAERMLTRLERTMANRGEYLPTPLFMAYETEAGLERVMFDQKFSSAGLLERMVQHIYGEQPRPAALSVLNKDTSGEFWKSVMLRLRREGYAVSGERLALDMRGPGWKHVLKAFPTAIDASAYAHGLTAPVMPQTYVPDAKLCFRKLCDADGNDLGTDGSGIYHPDAPEVRELVAKYGVRTWQIRALHPDLGVFVKGIMAPDEKNAVDENGNPALVCDWNMVKGAHKKLALQRRGENAVKSIGGFHLGALQVWYKRFHMGLTFEALECVKYCAESKALVEKLVKRGMKRLRTLGTNGIAAEVAAKDEGLSLIGNMLNAGADLGIHVDPMDIPRWYEAIRDRMNNQLYRMIVAAGTKAPAYIFRLDNRIPRGHIAVSGMSAGIEVAVYRFPLVLAQGLKVLKTCDVPEDHKVGGKETPYMAAMNPHDLVLGMQGDDDGDFGGISDNPDMVELFKLKLDDKLFRIEPKGTAILAKDGQILRTNTEEGLNHLMYDQRGPVGMLTVWRSQLLAAGDTMGARALSISIQEAIDKAKRHPEWSDFRKATDARNWTKLDDGTFTFTHRIPGDELQGLNFPLDLCKAWVGRRLVQAGCSRVSQDGFGNPITVGRNPLWWRRMNENGPRLVDISNIKVPELTPEQERFENLVHHSARLVMAEWEIIAKVEKPKSNFAVSSLLPMLLAAKGVHLDPMDLTWDELLRLRNKLGLSTFSSAMQKLPAGIGEEGARERARKVDAAQQRLNERLQNLWGAGDLTLEEMVTVWVMELQEENLSEEVPANPNNAWRVVAWPDSPVMAMLGLGDTVQCQFLQHDNRLEKAVNIAMASDDPFTSMRNQVAKETKHRSEVTDKDGNEMAMYRCPHCVRQLSNRLVAATRDQATKGTLPALLHLQGALKR